MKRVLVLLGTFALLQVPNGMAVELDFYGHNLSFETTNLNTFHTPSTFQKQNVADLVSRLNQKEESMLLYQIRAAQRAHDLDDLGLVILTQKISQQISTNRNTQSILQYHLLDRLGYDVKLTYTPRSLSCFGYMRDKPASSVYIFYEKKRYTNLDFKNLQVKGTRYIHHANIQAHRRIEFSGRAPKLSARTSTRSFKWYFQGKLYTLEAVNNQSFTEYLNDLPQFQLGKDYVNLKHSTQFETTVLAPLRSYMSAMSSNNQKANFLLNFVQNVFHYKTDNEQYGREKYNYPEETISTVYSDCEDRTLLLACLYKELMGLESVILHFEKEQHVCLGVRMPGRSNSYSFTYGDAPYMVCEPTGRGYSLGETAIELSHVSDVIELF